MITLKYKRETAKELPHTDVFHNGNYIGYIIKNGSLLAVKNENWNFCSKSELPYFHTKTKKEMIDKIKEMSKTL